MSIKYLLKDCARIVGNKEITFYESVSIGPFIVHCWSWPSAENGVTGKAFGLSVYEHGQIVNPTVDPRFRFSDLVQRVGSLKSSWYSLFIYIFSNKKASLNFHAPWRLSGIWPLEFKFPRLPCSFLSSFLDFNIYIFRTNQSFNGTELSMLLEDLALVHVKSINFSPLECWEGRRASPQFWFWM